MKLWDLNDHDRSALAALEGRGEEMTAQTIAWSRINSGSWNAEGLRAQAGPIEARMRDVFDTVTAHESEGIEVVTARGDVTLAPTGPVFLSTLRPDAPVQVVFTGHYDTVFPPDAGFDEVTDLGGGKLNGPGLADMKGGITVLLAALEAVEATGAAKGIGYRFCLTPDEEIGNPISAPFLKQAATGAHVGLTYEPALEDGGFAGARKGSGNFSIIIKGISSHAGRAHEAGRSAILAAAELVVAIEGRNGHQEGVTFNTGKIDGGGPNNQVPDKAVVRLNARAPDAEGQAWALAVVDDAVNRLRQKDGIEVEVHGGFYRPPKPLNAAQERLLTSVKDTGKALDLDLSWTDTGGVCEGNNVFAAGVPNVDTLGVRGGRIHSAEEFVETDSFVERASLSALILLRLAEGRINAAEIKQLMEAR